MNKCIGQMTKEELKDFIIELDEYNARLERKINKAIEYIESKEKEEHINDYDEHYMDDYLDDYDEHLLDILKESDKE